jgi:hypothetical protein
LLPDPDGRRLVVVHLGRWKVLVRLGRWKILVRNWGRLIDRVNWRWLIDSVNRGRLIGICLRRGLIVHFRRLRNYALRRYIARIGHWWFGNVDV